MSHTAFVTFRGQPDVAIEWEVIADSRVFGIEIEWTFADESTKDVGPTLTPEEEDAIMARLVEIASDPHFESNPFYD